MLAFLSPLLLYTALFTGVHADTDWGTEQTRDYQITYDTSVYGHGAAASQAFCECIGFVGPLDYHHQVECGVTQPGPTIFDICAAIKKQANGDYGTGPPCDYTLEVVARVSGASIASYPSSPIESCSSSSTSDVTTSEVQETATSNTIATSFAATTSSEDQQTTAAETDSQSLATDTSTSSDTLVLSSPQAMTALFSSENISTTDTSNPTSLWVDSSTNLSNSVVQTTVTTTAAPSSTILSALSSGSSTASDILAISSSDATGIQATSLHIVNRLILYTVITFVILVT